MPTVRQKIIAGLGAAALSIGLLSQVDGQAVAASNLVSVPAPAVDTRTPAKTATAVFAGGCFWGVQGVFQHVKGVTSAVSGYAGGARETARYEAVGSGSTGHAEAVRVTFDPARVSYGTLLRIYFAVVADPTTLNYQGPDHGTQYRSALFPTTAEQADVAKRYIAQLGQSKVWQRPIVTRIERFSGFYPAEAYHQDYLTLNPRSRYILINDLPKVMALKQGFPALYQANPVLVNGRI